MGMVWLPQILREPFLNTLSHLYPFLAECIKVIFIKFQKFEEVHGSMLGLGYILAYYVRWQRELQGKEDMITDAKETLIDYIKNFLNVVRK